MDDFCRVAFILSLDDIAKLQRLPVNQSINVTIGERQFTLLDEDTYKEICKRAGFKNTTVA